MGVGRLDCGHLRQPDGPTGASLGEEIAGVNSVQSRFQLNDFRRTGACRKAQMQNLKGNVDKTH